MLYNRRCVCLCFHIWGAGDGSCETNGFDKQSLELLELELYGMG